MNFLSGQDDFFQTANQPISVQHLSQPYNKVAYKTRVNITFTPLGDMGSLGSQSHSSSHSFVFGLIFPGLPSLMQHGTFAEEVEKHLLQNV